MVQQEPVIFDKGNPDYLKTDLKKEKFEIISQVIFQLYEHNYSGMEYIFLYTFIIFIYYYYFLSEIDF